PARGPTSTPSATGWCGRRRRSPRPSAVAPPDVLTRSELTARLLGVPGRAAGDAGRGLVIVQIDGLSGTVLKHALANGAMPVMRDLIEQSGYEVHAMYPGLPTSTPAVQAELFYGERGAVPAFAFVDRSEGRVVRMWQHGAVSEIEGRLNGQRGLLAGGSSYCNIYTGGADEARFCMASIGWTDPFRTRHPMALPALALLYSVDLARAA